jgi:predicted dehydrogenase
VHIALLGTGLAASIHSKALRAAAPDVRRSYASRDRDRAASAAHRFQGTGHFDSYDAALASPDIDAVLVGLPPSLHLAWTMRALDAGKHVIVEKPPFRDPTTCTRSRRRRGVPSVRCSWRRTTSTSRWPACCGG